jgi:hypothetical protein
MSLLELFCNVYQFCVQCQPTLNKRLLPDTKTRRHRKPSLCLSEVMTILVRFHHSGYRTFKDFYTKHVLVFLRAEFPGLVSYCRFVEFLPSAWAD